MLIKFLKGVHIVLLLLPLQGEDGDLVIKASEKNQFVLRIGIEADQWILTVRHRSSVIYYP